MPESIFVLEFNLRLRLNIDRRIWSGLEFRRNVSGNLGKIASIIWSYAYSHLVTSLIRTNSLI